ncbi:MAG: allophanate hydrolase-related protein [Frankia sp.]
MTEVRMFVNGEAMSGGGLHGALRDAVFLGAVHTAPDYWFYSVRDEFPGLYPVAEDGWTVPGELYQVSYRTLREELLPREPPELELTLIRLADGSGSLSMRMRTEALSAPGVRDISSRGGWRAYLASPSAH